MTKPLEMINCHSHIFTLNNVPKNFVPFGLTYFLARIPFYKFLAKILRFTDKIIPRSRLSRYGNLLELGLHQTQADIAENLAGYYPNNTKFVVLPMDLSYMGAGKPKQSVMDQHLKLLELVKNNKNILPFIAIDPRRQQLDNIDLIQFINDLLRHKDENNKSYFKGIKLYPSQGFLPTNPFLNPVYELCEIEQLPIMSHCTRGGIKPKNMDKKEATLYADPDHYIPVMRRYPKLKICLAHFGGYTDWDKYFEQPESRIIYDLDDNTNRHKMNWLSKVLQLIKCGEFPNLYTDVSYTVFIKNMYMPILKVLLYSDVIREKTLFGSDYYMVEIERFDERYISMKLRAELGDEVFRQIACENPKKYLGL